MENQGLIEAIKRKNLDDIKDFLDQGGNINELINEDMPPLIYAIDRCHKKPKGNLYDDIILCLINAGANVNVTHPRKNFTALMLALKNNRSDEVVLRLINAGSDVKECVRGETALIYAIQNYYSKNIIAELINKGADVNQPLVEFTPLYCAISWDRSLEIVKLLINSGANVHVRDWCGRNLLNLPCRDSCEINGLCKYKQITDVLIKTGVDIKNRDYAGNTIIHNVNCNYIIYLALKNGVSIETKNHEDKTPLYQAILYYQQKKVNDLLLYNANPNCVDKYLNTPLLYSKVIYSKFLSTVMLYHGADLLTQNEKKTSPMKLVLLDFNKYPINDLQEGIKVVLQHYLFFINENGLDDRINEFRSKRKKLYISFLNRCKIELSKMRTTFIKEELSFYHFCQLKKLYRNKFISILMEEYKYGYKQIRKLFPIYQDFIIMRIKDNSKEKFRHDMIKNLEKISVQPLPVSETNSNVQLVYDCWYKIGQYLDYEQLYNLFLASFEN